MRSKVWKTLGSKWPIIAIVDQTNEISLTVQVSNNPLTMQVYVGNSTKKKNKKSYKPTGANKVSCSTTILAVARLTIETFRF